MGRALGSEEEKEKGKKRLADNQVLIGIFWWRAATLAEPGGGKKEKVDTEEPDDNIKGVSTV